VMGGADECAHTVLSLVHGAEHGDLSDSPKGS
jgi:hypothetical protein